MMWKSKPVVIVTLFIAAGIVAATWQAAGGHEKQEGAKVLRHVVLFKFKESAAASDVRAVEDAFRELPSKIDSVVDFEWGTDNSPEGLSKGFTHCFFVSFKDEKGRAEYLPHPAHQEFVKLLRPSLEDVLVVDYWTQK